MSSIPVILVTAYMIYGCSAAGIVFSTTPQSRNVSAGTMVEFTCAAPASGLTSFGISTTPPVGGSVVDDNILPNGDRQVTLSFIAPSDQTNISIVCVALKGTDLNQSFAVLMIQGLLSSVSDLTSTTVDSCSLHFTWIAPNSLDGVAINYTIDIKDTNGMLVQSDTTNTTEYFYNVSSLGETLEIEVAAVNGAGPGNTTIIMTKTPSSISTMKFTNTLMNTSRTNSSTNTNWTYTFEYEKSSVCGKAISHITAEACLSSSCNSTVSMLPDGERRVMATFTDLMENRKYTATLNIHYNGGVVQQSLPMPESLSTYDLHNAEVMNKENGRVCLSVEFVEGRVQSAYILFRCSSTGTEHSGIIDQTTGCIDVDPHLSYTIFATDNDINAVKEINDVAPVIITGVSVPGFTSTIPTQSIVLSSSTTPSNQPSNDSNTATIVSAIVAVVVIALAAIAIIAILARVLKLHYCYKRFPKVQQTSVELDLPQPISRQQSRLVEVDDHPLNIEQAVQEPVYADLDNNSKGAPRTAPSLDAEVSYCDSNNLMSTEVQECLEWLGNCTLQLDSYVLSNFLRPLKNYWKDLGVALSLSDHLDSIETRNSANDQRLQQVLITWYENQHEGKPFTWDTLDRVLRSIKVNGASILANEVAKTVSSLL